MNESTPLKDKLALIVANGELPGNAVLASLWAQVSTVICADGAANSVRAAGLVPDVVIGDLDSITPETKEAFSGKVEIIERPSQYATDLEKAFAHAVERGFTSAVVIGIRGGRYDHAITNLLVLHKWVDRISIRIEDDLGEGVLLSAHCGPVRHKLQVAVGQTVSLLSCREASGIVTQGLKYPLHNESLAWGVRDGQSNEVATLPAVVSFSGGVLLVYVVRGG